MSGTPRIPAHSSPDLQSGSTLGRGAPKARPIELDDREWLAKRHAEASDYVIARELGCGASTVRDARKRLGIETERQRRGSARAPAKPSTLVLLAERFAGDQQHRIPPTRETLIARCKGWLDAEHHHDRPAAQDALLSIASAALLIHQESRRTA